MSHISEAAVIFVVSAVVLFIVHLITATSKAYGMGWFNMKGITFMLLGGLFFVAGLAMRLLTADVVLRLVKFGGR